MRKSHEGLLGGGNFLLGLFTGGAATVLLLILLDFLKVVPSEGSVMTLVGALAGAAIAFAGQLIAVLSDRKERALKDAETRATQVASIQVKILQTLSRNEVIRSGFEKAERDVDKSNEGHISLAAAEIPHSFAPVDFTSEEMSLGLSALTQDEKFTFVSFADTWRSIVDLSESYRTERKVLMASLKIKGYAAGGRATVEISDKPKFDASVAQLDFKAQLLSALSKKLFDQGGRLLIDLTVGVQEKLSVVPTFLTVEYMKGKLDQIRTEASQQS